MFFTKEYFKKSYINKFESMYGKDFKEATSLEQYNTLGVMVREYISKAWIETKKSYQKANGKQAYYFSIEFLLGRLLASNLLNLGIDKIVEEGLKELGVNLKEVEEQEIDAGLGNGGLGRLAACFLDSLASLGLPGHGVGIRYKHGLFEQKILESAQIELPEEWLRNSNPWEVKRTGETIKVKFGGEVRTSFIDGRLTFQQVNTQKVLAVPYDIPVVGYKNQRVNTLRLWSAEPAPYEPAIIDIMNYRRETEAISEFLYPDDTKPEGKLLRLKQQYFLVSAGLQDIVNSYLKKGNNLLDFQNKVSIHVNDTHPVLAIPELMRILLDEQGLGWDEAWHITVNTVSYTNHTIMAEALEKWPIDMVSSLLPRIYMIIEEINRRFCLGLENRYPGKGKELEELAIIANGEIKMANLALVGSHSVNGVAKLHTEILKQREMKSFYKLFPNKFNNKTNGITHRRWLLQANPKLAELINNIIGSRWINNPEELKALESYAQDSSFQDLISKVKAENKKALAKKIERQTGLAVDENSIFDVHVKRFHAYKRQLLNALHIMYLYNRLKEDSTFTLTPRTFIFGGKAAPAYYYAKKIIKLINVIASKINQDPETNKILKVIFLENYRVSFAEEIFPATDVSEQISTASKEASGTGNMKLMINGALTLGTLDGANIEILEQVGENNIFTFGLTSEEVIHYSKRGGYKAYEYYQRDERIKKVLDNLINGFLPAPLYEFQELYDSLIKDNDQYFLLKDFDSYVKAQELIGLAYENQQGWLEKSIINIANAGIFSSDRTIKEYALDIWKLKPH